MDGGEGEERKGEGEEGREGGGKVHSPSPSDSSTDALTSQQSNEPLLFDDHDLRDLAYVSVTELVETIISDVQHVQTLIVSQQDPLYSNGSVQLTKLANLYYIASKHLGALLLIQSISLAFEHSISVHGKFMVCMCSQFQCTPTAHTNHKLP